MIALFSLLGIALGVGTLIVVLAVMSGFRAELLGRVLGLNGHITLRSGPEGMADFDAIADRLRGAADVLSVTPLVTGQVMVSAHDVASGALVRGIRPEDLAARDTLATHVQRGSIAKLEPNQIAIGSRMAYRMALDLGDRLTLISPQGTPTAFGTVPRIKAYEIGAIFEVGMFEYDNTLIFMPLEAAQLYFQLEGRANELEIMVADPDRVAAYRRELQPLIGDAGQLVDWQQANASFFTALKVERNVMFLILSLIIMVAAFNIISGMIMLVKDKGRDIAILRTMGATRGAIMRVFFLSGAAIGVTGTLAGLPARPRLRRQHRDHPPVAAAAHRHRPVLGRDLLPLPPAGADRGRRRRERRADEPRPLAARDALPVLARRAARSGRGAAL